jgi:uncharacterized protein
MTMSTPQPGSHQLVDCHAHLFPERLARAVRQALERYGLGPFAYPLDNGRVLESLVAAGVSTVWSLPYAHAPGVAGSLNAAMAELATELTSHEFEVVGGMTAHPEDRDPAATIEQGVAYGLRVVKLHCSVGKYDIDDPGFAGMWEAIAHHRLPVVIHLGHATSGRTQAAEVTGLGRVAAQHPTISLIVAHAGHPSEQATAALMHAFPNVFADTTPVDDHPAALAAGGFGQLADRILFGTDVPNTSRTVETSIEDVQRQLGDAALVQMAETAERLLAAASDTSAT